MKDDRTIQKEIERKYNHYNTVIDPVTGEVKTRKQRARSFKRFERDVDEVLRGHFCYESVFDLMCVLSELDIRVTASVGETGVHSYCVQTMDGKYKMASISLTRALLTLVQKTIPIPGVYTEKQIKRIKCIIRINTVLGQAKLKKKQREDAIFIEDDDE